MSWSWNPEMYLYIIVMVVCCETEAANVLVMHSLGIGSHVNTLSALSQRLMEGHGHKVCTSLSLTKMR